MAPVVVTRRRSQEDFISCCEQFRGPSLVKCCNCLMD